MPLVRVLNVAEKNDAAKSISDAMSNGRYRKREGLSKFNKIYEFEYRLLGQNCMMTFTSVSGHMLGLEFPLQYRKWYSCSPAELFDVPVHKYCPKDFEGIKATLEREVRQCQYLVIWTDCDREGENIGFEVIKVCQAVKPTIPVYRAKFSEITPHAVARAAHNLIQPDQLVNDAVDVRQELDLRIGAAFTRFQTLRLKKVFPEKLADQLISYGSCQFPTLGFVVERYKQVQAFVPEPFWKLRVTHERDEEAKAEFVWERNRLFDHLACLVLFEQCIENPIATVVDVFTKDKSKWRPQPLDTVELEKLASRKLRINAKETMKVAEKLYTQGYISYPRTETNIFPKEMDLVGLVQDQTQDPNWGEFAQRVLQHGPHPRNGKKTDNAHPPIHPLKWVPTASLRDVNEQRIYEFIVRHFLACCSQDALGHETRVKINVAEELFTAQGLMILARNYLDVYPYDRWNAKEIPLYSPGDTFEPSTIEMVASETSPPPLLTEADLIALMEKHGIGTDATHAEHIETIKSRMYVGLRPDSRFVPGELGMGLVEGYDDMGYEMSKPNLRAELEADLKAICEGRKRKNDVLAEQVRKYKEVFLEATRQAQKLDEALSQYLGEAQPFTAEPVRAISVVMPCPKCGQGLALRTKKEGRGYFIGCTNYPTCRHALWLPDSVLEVNVEPETCPNCQPGPVHLLKFRFRPGSMPPVIPNDFTGCVGGCDEMLSEALGIARQAAQHTNRNAPQGQGGSVTPIQQQPRPPPNAVNNTRPRPLQQGQPANPANNRRNSGSGIPPSFPSNTASGNFTTNAGSRVGGPATPRGRGGGRGLGSSRVPLGVVDPNRPGSRRSFGGGGQDGGSGSAIVCNCGDDAVQLTVRKEGPNTGRQFYKCRKPQGEGCNFFLWADEQDRDRSSSTSGSFQAPRVTANSWGGAPDDNSSVQCNCGTPAKRLRVQKEGPNTGREFFGCTKPRAEGCGFFQWADEAPSSGGDYGTGANNYQSRGRGRGGGGASAGQKRKVAATPAAGSRRARRCGLCGDEGHTKRTCPHNAP
ncbi:hypothetical protein BaRGS_00014309 [Batillaria attramentaria]|uniref:DNA topoisomerase n=1 Tax=Batillaria attramentaria TaxID=370345 RepID=A0ABD0L4V0_9CAEN